MDLFVKVCFAETLVLTFKRVGFFLNIAVFHIPNNNIENLRLTTINFNKLVRSFQGINFKLRQRR